VEPTDIVMIHQLLGLYGHILDAREWDRLPELFTPDAELDYTGVHAPKLYRGIPEIRGYFERANHPSAHHVTNIFVHRHDGDVVVKSKFFVPFTRASHEVHRWYGGDYDDVVVETPQGWRFRAKTCTERWQFTQGEGPVGELRATF